MEIIYRSTHAQDCLDRSLVFAAMNIDYVVRRDWWGWCVLVDDAALPEAMAQLATYEEENSSVPMPDEVSPPRRGARLGVAVYAALLLTLFSWQGDYSFGIDWTSAGRVDVAAIEAGQYWRTVTALTLHRDLWHLLGNLGFGSLFGIFLARQLGGGVTWLAILAAGTLGNAMNVWVQSPGHLSIGASTAVFAAVGLLAAFYFFFGSLNRATWARRWAPIVGGLWVLTWLGTGDESTDIVAHLTGFLAGLLLGSVMGRVPKPSRYDSALQWASGLTALGVVAFAWSLAIA